MSKVVTTNVIPDDASNDLLTIGVAGVFTNESFTSTGANTWTCPSGVTSIDILTVAGGGGGGSFGFKNPMLHPYF